MLESEIEPHARELVTNVHLLSRAARGTQLEIIPLEVMAESQRRYLILEETI